MDTICVSTVESLLIEALVKTEPNIAVYLDGNQNLLLFNQKAVELFNVSSRALEGSNFMQLFENRGWKYPLSHRQFSSPTRQVVTTTITNGQIEWVILAVPQKDKEMYFFVTGKVCDEVPIDLHKENSHVLNDIIDNMPFSVFWKNTSLEYRGCNQHYLELLGLSHKQQILGKKEQSVITSNKESSTILQQLEREILRGEHNEASIEIAYQLPNKKISNLNFIKTPIYDHHGEVMGVLSVCIDLTEIEKEKKRIEQLSVELQTIIDNVPCAVFWKDTESRFLGCNKRFAEFANLNPEDIVGKTDYELPWSREESDNYRADDKKVMMLKQAKLNIEEPQTTPDGRNIVLSTSKVPLVDQRDNVLGVLAIYTDITELKTAQQATTELLVAQEKAKVFKLLSSSIAHELRTPLASIYHASFAVNKVFPALLDGYHRAQEAGLPVQSISASRLNSFSGVVGRIESEVQTCNIFIDMTLSKLRYERIVLNELEPIAIIEAIEEAVALYPFKQEQQHLIIKNYQQEENFVFLGEKLSFRHVLFNLIKNALYFIAAKGRGEITIWLEHDNEANYLCFKDTAQGISKEQAELLFQEFYTTHEEGTGLGLTFCKTMMQAIGGDITCEGKKDEYICFRIMVPKVKKEVS